MPDDWRERLESLADAWQRAPVRLRAEMLRAIFESVVIVLAGAVVQPASGPA